MRRSSAESSCRLRLARHRGQQGVRKLPPDRRSDLREPPWPNPAGRAAPSAKRASSEEPTAQATERRRSTRLAAPSPSASSTALVISSTNSGMPSLRSTMSCRRLAGKELVAGDAVDHGVDFALRQPIDGERGHVRPSDPRRFEFRPERHDQQRAKTRDPVDRPTERFQAGRVGPMRILEDHQHRILARQRFHLRNERLQRSLPALRPGPDRARDSGHRSAATAFRRTARRPRSRSRSARAPHRACRASLGGASSRASPAARCIWPMIG